MITEKPSGSTISRRAEHWTSESGATARRTCSGAWTTFRWRRFTRRFAVVLIGTNNTHNTAPEIAAGVRAVLTKTQTVFPGIRIVLMSIMPNQRANDLMMSADTLIRKFADNKTIYYLDLVPLMTPVGDNWKGLGPDHLHLTAEGYQLWADALQPLLAKLLPKS